MYAKCIMSMFLVATTKKQKETNEINFTNMFYMAHLMGWKCIPPKFIICLIPKPSIA